MQSTDSNDLTPDERAAFDALPRSRQPSEFLEERVVGRLRREGIVGAAGRRAGRGWSPSWLAAGVAASVALFAGGVAVGQWLATRSTLEAMVTVQQHSAEQAAVLVQRSSSAYTAALAALARVPASADSSEVAQGKEAALTALYAVAEEMVRLAPNDPVVVRILQAFDQRTSTTPGTDPASGGMRQVVWF